MRPFVLSLIVAALTITSAFAENWGHWRGPTGNSVSLTANPPVHWSPTKNIKWKVAIPGRGSGSPVIWGNQVFVVSAVRSDGLASTQPTQSYGRRNGGGAAIHRLQFKIFAFDRDTGNLRWQQTATEATPHQETHSTNNYASASPCTDGEHVYAHFGSRGLYCYTIDGKFVWKRDDLGKMVTRNGFGEGSSPTIAGDKILVPWDHEGPSFLYALDKKTGQTVWKTPRDEPSCWATPLVVKNDGQMQVVMNGQNKARSYDLTDGKERWSCAGQTQRPCASPVASDGLVFVGSGHRGNFLGAFRVGGTGNIENTASVAWTIQRDCPDIASPLLSGNRLFFHKGKSGQLSCVDSSTGKPFYSAARINGISSTYASPVAAGGRVYLTGRSGTTVVVEDSNSLKIIATNSVGEGVDATPAPVDNQLFIRGSQHLFCIAE